MVRKYGTYVTKNGLKVKSKLEVSIAEQLDGAGIEYEYEPVKLKWRDYDPRAKCDSCGTKGATYKERLYSPDFRLKDGTFIEGKGVLDARARKLFIGVREHNPDVSIYVCFGRDNTLSRKSRTRYSEWAKKRNFKYCVGRIPASWLK